MGTKEDGLYVYAKNEPGEERGKRWVNGAVLPPCPRGGQAVDKVWCGFGEILGEWDGCNVLGVRGICGL